jgi:hypothetical protein
VLLSGGSPQRTGPGFGDGARHRASQAQFDRGLVTAVGLGHDAGMDYETAQLRLPPHVDRVTAAVQLAIAAEYSGWELARVQLFRDGTRKVVLRRRRTVPALPALSY